MFLFIYFWLSWVFVAVQAFSSSEGTGFSCFGARPLWHGGSVVTAHTLSCSQAGGIFLDQGSNPCPLHWQVDSLPLDHLGSPYSAFVKNILNYGYIYIISPS